VIVVRGECAGGGGALGTSRKLEMWVADAEGGIQLSVC